MSVTKPGASVCAFNQVVAEQGIAREAAVENGVQDGDFIDALAGEDALSVEVLVSVGDGQGVDVKTALAGVKIGQARTCCRADADADTRLKNAVALNHNAQVRIDDGLVEGMSDGADHTRSRSRGKLGVGVEGEDVADRVQGVKPACFDGKRIVLADE